MNDESMMSPSRDEPSKAKPPPKPKPQAKEAAPKTSSAPSKPAAAKGNAPAV